MLLKSLIRHKEFFYKTKRGFLINVLEDFSTKYNLKFYQKNPEMCICICKWVCDLSIYLSVCLFFKYFSCCESSLEIKCLPG